MNSGTWQISRRELRHANAGHLRSTGMLALFLVLTFLAPLLSAGLDMTGWYAELKKPDLSPPPYVFGPVWTLLYILMGVSAWGVWQAAGWSRALVPWAIQLVLNAAWTPLFFGLHQPGWAFADIVLLWIFIIVTMLAFSSVRPWTAWLLVPYLAWVSFAAYLNFSIWRLNP